MGFVPQPNLHDDLDCQSTSLAPAIALPQYKPFDRDRLDINTEKVD
ncbi:hypothetical protein [Geitlerinema calcuttense]|uniref:Uncharacterized protein n=1 Tax=Geitlerinema calcuttense NRMC-F 0142 TaxID=2922238 RepID=A0ABT7M3I6_9CYAN|nr:hypothetical protein [Geitlerinema calcuttense]MDL5057616.1 hypothetical protein [Geitlerinema calcuttense NRMC-F 0142]